MALFLNESLTDFDTETISIEEAYEGLLEATFEMHDLTESLLQADFIIHENAQYLTEEEQENKEANFFINALTAIRKFIIKVKDRLFNFIKSIAEKLQGVWARITNKETNPDGKVKVVKNGLENATRLNQLSENVQIAANSTETDPKKYKANVDAASGIFNKVFETLKNTVTSKDENNLVVVDANKLKNIIGVGTALLSGGLIIQNKLSSSAKAVEEVEVKAKRSFFGGNKMSKGEVAQFKKEQRMKNNPIGEMAKEQANSFVKGTGIMAKAKKYAIGVVINYATKKLKV